MYYYDPRQINLFPFQPGQQGPPATPPPFFPGGGGQGTPGFPFFGPPGGNQGFPPFPPVEKNNGTIPPFPGFPGQSQGQNPAGGPALNPNQLPPPPANPPAAAAASGPSLKAVDSGAIRGCLNRYTYIRLEGREQFWMYPTFVGRKSVSGYRWYGFMWLYYGVDLTQIKSFQCV